MQLEEFKSKLIDETLNRWSNTTAYRWSDVFDYICDYWDLDKDWENYFNLAAKTLDKTFDECYIIALNEEKYRTEPRILENLVTVIVPMLEKRLEESLGEKL
jgi:hypothetical protein